MQHNRELLKSYVGGMLLGKQNSAKKNLQKDKAPIPAYISQELLLQGTGLLLIKEDLVRFDPVKFGLGTMHTTV